MGIKWSNDLPRPEKANLQSELKVRNILDSTLKRRQQEEDCGKIDGGIGSPRNMSPHLEDNCYARNSAVTILEFWRPLKACNFQGKTWKSKLWLISVNFSS